MSEKSLAVFTQDAWRLLHESRECVNRLTSTPEGSPQSRMWNELLEKIHSLKGTAAMMRKTTPLAEVLHSLEGDLITRSADSALPLDHVRATLDQAQGILTDLGFPRPDESPKSVPRGPVSSATRGILIECQGKEYWIPLDSVLRVFTEAEMTGRKFVFLEGAWLPVIGPDRCHAAVGVWCTHGKLVVRVERVFGVFQLGHERAKSADRLWESALFCQRSAA